MSCYGKNLRYRSFETPTAAPSTVTRRSGCGCHAQSASFSFPRTSLLPSHTSAASSICQSCPPTAAGSSRPLTLAAPPLPAASPAPVRQCSCKANCNGTVVAAAAAAAVGSGHRQKGKWPSVRSRPLGWQAAMWSRSHDDTGCAAIGSSSGGGIRVRELQTIDRADTVAAAAVRRSRGRGRGMYGGDEGGRMVHNEDEEEEEEEGDGDGTWQDMDADEDQQQQPEEGGDAAILARFVVQVHTLHRVPNFTRPWEEGHDAESTSSGFVVELPGGPAAGSGRDSGGDEEGGSGRGRRQLLIMTTAGAVEHARKVEVRRAADDAAPHPATVAAVCLDLDVALLRVNDPAFWEGQVEEEEGRGTGTRRQDQGRRRGLGPRQRRAGTLGGRGAEVRGKPTAAAAVVADEGQGDDVEAEDEEGEEKDMEESGGDGGRLVPLQLDRRLPHLRQSVVVAGFPLGGGSLCVTRGVVSRIEVLEYSHSGRGLLALQVDAPLNNGGWGGPALCPTSGVVLGMAFQKFASQTWMERYDEGAAEAYGAVEDEEEGGEEGGSGGRGEGDDDYGGHVQDYDDDAENIGYLVPSQLLALVLEDYRTALTRGSQPTSTVTTSTSRSVPTPVTTRRGSRNPSRDAGAPLNHGSDAPLYLDGRPRLGLRYQRLESPVLRRALGLGGGRGGVLVTGVDPSGSAAGVLHVHDVLVAVGGRQVAYDGTTLLRPGQRVLFGHWASVGAVGDQLPVTVLRNGQLLELSIRLRDASAPFLPVSLGLGRRPQYLVVGPLVFIAFSLPYWYELMAGQQQRRGGAAERRRLQSALVPILGALEWGLPAADDGEEVVLLSEVLQCGEDDGVEAPLSGSAHSDAGAGDEENSTDVESGSDGSPAAGPQPAGVGSEAAAWASELQGVPRRLATLNGARVRNLAQLAEAVVAVSGPGGASSSEGKSQLFLRLGLEPSQPPAVRSAATAVAATLSGGCNSSATQHHPGSHHSNTSSTTGPSASSSSDGTSSSSDTVTSSSTTSANTAVATEALSGSGLVLVLDCGRLAADTRTVLRHHSLAAAMPQELRRQLATNWPFSVGEEAAGASRQRRQQGRRLSLAGGRRG